MQSCPWKIPVSSNMREAYDPEVQQGEYQLAFICTRILSLPSGPCHPLQDLPGHSSDRPAAPCIPGRHRTYLPYPA